MDAVPTHRPETLAAGLAAFGVRSGSKVAVMAIGDAAALAHRAITVAGCESLTVPPDAMGVRLSVRLRGVLAVLAAGDEQTRAIGMVAGDLTELSYLWRLDAGGLDELAAAASGRLPLAID
ncbi:MAG: hypothetical protein ACR2P2_22195 [Nakamurella sp.]